MEAGNKSVTYFLNRFRLKRQNITWRLDGRNLFFDFHLQKQFIWWNLQNSTRHFTT